MSPRPVNPNPVEVVEELYRLFGEGKLEETLELMHPDVVLSEPGDVAVVPWAGEFHGHEGVRRFYQALADALTEVEILPDSLRLLGVGDRAVMAMGTERGVASATGKTYLTNSAWFWEFTDGRISRLFAFHDTAAMVEALRG